MKYEYLLLHLVIIAGPLGLSFERRIHFAAQWRRIAASILPPALLFIIWDSHVTNRHWFFNPAYTLDFRLLGLPIEEVLFFFTVPYASLFVWANLRLYLRQRCFGALRLIRVALMLALPAGIVLHGTGQEYTALSLMAVGGAALMDKALHTELFTDMRYWVFLAITSLLILVFNGYLTARPIVLYDAQYQLDFRVTTIPIEDFFYGYALLTAVVVLYEAWNTKEQYE